MDTTGEIIRRLRREKGLTQLALANLLHLSDRTVSKWECGRGLPDPGLLPELARLLGAGAEELLRGDLRENPPQGGNMKNSQALFLSALRRGVLQVYFDQYGMHYFRYPQAFDSCQLTAEDPELPLWLERQAAASEK